MALAMALGIPFLVYLIWQPGDEATQVDYPDNAIWIGHGWLGDDLWFQRNQRGKENFRTDAAIETLLTKLQRNRIRTVYPHLCPAQMNGRIAPYDAEQVERFLDHTQKYDIVAMPWIGGVFEGSARVHDPQWRRNFVDSVEELVKNHPRIAGVQVNIEPMPSGNTDFLLLLDELRPALDGRSLSVAAYPPPTKWHPFPDVHWEPEYLHEVAGRSDQVAVMMYDTAIKFEKFYILLMKQWTKELIDAVAETNCELLLGVPAYEDADSGYHHPAVENLGSALSGILAAKPGNAINGIAIYCEWEMTPQKWQLWQKALSLQ